MRLAEDLQQDVIDACQEVIDLYQDFHEACANLQGICTDLGNVRVEANNLYDLCDTSLYDQLHETAEAIADEYYPRDYGDNEDDPIEANEISTNSKDIRNNIFRDFTIDK